jgi:hypothetical protein
MTKFKTKVYGTLFVTLTTVALILPYGQSHGANKNPGIIPLNAKYRGLSYGEWEAKFWQAAFAIPVVDGEHPLITGGAFGGEDGVVFLAGIGGGATIEVTIPPGTALFFPVINTECSEIEPPPFHGDDEAEMRANANAIIDDTSDRFAVIDGVAVKNLDSYRTQSPLFEFGPLPEDNILEFSGEDAPAGATSPSVDAGFYLLLPPLSAGEHVIHFGGTFDDFGFSIDTTYVITVSKH